MHTPDWERIDRDRAIATAFSLTPAQREQIHRRAEAAGLRLEESIVLANSVEVAARDDMVRRAILADLPLARQKPPVSRELEQVHEYVAKQREDLLEIERLATALHHAVLAAGGRIASGLAYLGLVDRGEQTPGSEDHLAWEALEVAAQQDALHSVDHIARAARAAMPAEIAPIQKGHDLADLVLTIREAIDATLPFGTEIMDRHTQSPAAPLGLLVQLTSEAIAAMRRYGANIPDYTDLRKIIDRILKQELAAMDKIAQ